MLIPDLRHRVANQQAIRADGQYVLYWMIAFRRTKYNFALQHAVEAAVVLGLIDTLGKRQLQLGRIEVDAIMPVLESTYGKSDAVRWFNRWRMFYLACSELFGFGGGDEWFVAHYLFANKRSPATSDKATLAEASC